MPHLQVILSSSDATFKTILLVSEHSSNYLPTFFSSVQMFGETFYFIKVMVIEIFRK